RGKREDPRRPGRDRGGGNRSLAQKSGTTVLSSFAWIRVKHEYQTMVSTLSDTQATWPSAKATKRPPGWSLSAPRLLSSSVLGGITPAYVPFVEPMTMPWPISLTNRNGFVPRGIGVPSGLDRKSVV